MRANITHANTAPIEGKIASSSPLRANGNPGHAIVDPKVFPRPTALPIAVRAEPSLQPLHLILYFGGIGIGPDIVPNQIEAAPGRRLPTIGIRLFNPQPTRIARQQVRGDQADHVRGLLEHPGLSRGGAVSIALDGVTRGLNYGSDTALATR